MLLIFDIDGTLCNTKEIGDNCFIETFENIFNCSLTNIQWENFQNVTDTGLLTDLLLKYSNESLSQKLLNNFANVYHARLSQLLNQVKVSLVNGAETFIQHCQNQNISIAIATGNWKEIADLKMTHCHFNYTNIPLSSSNDAFTREDILLSVVEKSKTFYNSKRFDKVIYFGDGLWDYQCAKNLSVEFIGVDINNNKKLTSTDTKLIVNDFSNFDFILKHINNL